MYLLRLFALIYEILSEFNFYVRVRTYEKRVTGMQPLLFRVLSTMAVAN